MSHRIDPDQMNYLEGVIDDLVKFSNIEFGFFKSRENHEMAMGFVRERAGTIRKILAENGVSSGNPGGIWICLE